MSDNQQVEARELASENEALKATNQLLMQKTEFQDQFKEHVRDVESRVRAGQFQLGLAGLLVLCLAWLGTYDTLSRNIEERLDKEFSREEIRSLISSAATDAAHKIIRERLTASGAKESDQIKCLLERLGRDLFFTQCHTSGGDLDIARGVCITRDGKEQYYEAAFPKIDCGNISEVGAAPPTTTQ